MNLFRSLKVDEREMYIWFVVPACALKGLPFWHAGLTLTLLFAVELLPHVITKLFFPPCPSKWKHLSVFDSSTLLLGVISR